MKNDLVAAIEHQESLADADGTLAEERAGAIDRYLGRPYGNEIEGRSQVVMRDVADTIEWIKPSLMKVFASGDEVCRFDPTGPEDVQQAEQETEYCNYVLNQKNNGFLILHDWFHDALLQKTGYVLVQYEREEVKSRESYKGLSDDEFALLMQGEPEVLEYTAYPGPIGMMHDVVIRATQEYGCTKITNIAPERVKVSADWPDMNLQGCPFVEVIDYPTISDLRQKGYNVDDNISDASTNTEDEFSNREASWEDPEDQQADPATRRVCTRYVWMLFDEDGDGIAELRRIVIVGTTILENEETDITPVCAITPTRLPHEHHGLSIDDLVSDLQEIRTALTRGFLDNMYLANNGRYAIDANVVNLDDMLVSRPGGVVRVNGPTNGALMPLVHPQEGGTIIQAIEYVDTVRENRTGVTKYNQGLDAQSLNKTARGINQIMSASQQRIELIARLFAETGVKALFLIIHAISVANGRKQEMIQLRNEWVPVDPRSWKTRRDVTVSVGLGTGNKDQMLQHLQMILLAQKEAFPLGIATPENIYNALEKLTQNAGFKQPEEFWTNPKKNPPQPPAPSPEQIKAQADMQAEQMRLQAEQQKFQATAQLDMRAKQMDQEFEAKKLEFDAEMTRQQQEFEAQQKELDRQLQLILAKMQEDAKFAVVDRQENARQQSLIYTTQNNAENASAVSSTGKGIEKLYQTMDQVLKYVSAPRKLLRDKTGKAIGAVIDDGK